MVAKNQEITMKKINKYNQVVGGAIRKREADCGHPECCLLNAAPVPARRRLEWHLPALLS